jgi:hypothetical protein
MKYKPKEIQLFAYNDGTYMAHPVFENWEDHADLLDDDGLIQLEFEDTLDKILKQYRRKLLEQPLDKYERKVLLITDVEKYFI